ncbi:MAG: hypothetical protein LBB53_06280 [Prevotellaceae bacterium]|jgi:hypothetical protein|nr:hypothetical protein [Prevotellaceae bacterium]
MKICLLFVFFTTLYFSCFSRLLSIDAQWQGDFLQWQGQNMQWQGDFLQWQGQNMRWQGDFLQWQGQNMRWQGDFLQ